MTQPSALTAAGPDRPVHIGERVARTLTDELARHRGPKSGLLVGASAGSPVLDAAIDALQPGDTLTLAPTGDRADGPASAAGLRAHLESLGSWVAERVDVVDSLADAGQADALVLAEPLTGGSEQARVALGEVGKHLADGGVLSVAVPLFGGGATAEMDRQAALFGVGSDLVLRNNPPVRVHRFRFTQADTAVAGRLLPAYRPSSVPLTRNMHLDSNGVAAAGITLGLAALARAGRPKSRLWLLPALAAPAVAAFFRDPERTPPEDEAAVLAASDGKVLSVEQVHDDRFGGQRDFLRVAVFLSVLDVHVNRAPVAGRVVDYFVTDGGFAAAMKPDAEHNVAAYTVLDTANGTVVVAQRTGLIARRIVQRAPVGTLLARGERMGLIRFGSRTDVYLPADRADAVVAAGDRVTGGSTVLARWR